MTTAPLLAALLAAAAPAPAPSVGAIRIQLFYEGTGRLSRDIAPPVDFAGWNTVIGEGSAEEAANDLLVTVEVRGPPGEDVGQLSLVARSGRKVIAQRRFDHLSTTVQGRTWKALWLNDVGCAGRIEIVATIGRATKTSAISLDCGE